MSAPFDGARLRDIRERKFMSQRALALASGVARSAIVDLETGKRRPHGTTVHRLAHGLQVEPEEFTSSTTEAA